MPVYQLDERVIFPHPSLAEEYGLLAIGGDLSPERIITAYVNGIFPWYSQGEPIHWWSPDPRCVLFPESISQPRVCVCWLRKIFLKCALILLLIM